MAINQHEQPLGPSVPEEAGRLETIESIAMPDGSVTPVNRLAMKALGASMEAGLSLHKAAEMYSGWDPDYPMTHVYRDLSQYL